MTNVQLEIEQERRRTLLEAYSINTDGFELLNTFFLADVILREQNKFSLWLINKGFFKAATWIRRLKVDQCCDPRFELWQSITISNPNGTSVYHQTGCINDTDAEQSREYILNKYQLSN